MTAPLSFDVLPRSRRRRIVAASVLRTLAVATALFLVYFTAPFDAQTTAVEVVLLLGGIMALVPLVGWQVRAVVRARYPTMRALEALGSTIPLLLVIFAAAYYLMGRNDPATFTQPMTRIDALYFTITVFATVGFGDIAARSEVARVVVSFQMVLDLVVLGLGLRALLAAIQLNRQRQSTAPGSGVTTGSPLSGEDGPVPPP